MTKSGASDADRRYFERVARANAALANEAAPTSLEEMFERLERMQRLHGPLAEAGQVGNGDGDLDSHLAFLQRQHEVMRRAARRR